MALYVPNYASLDPDTAQDLGMELIRRNPLATVISYDEAQPEPWISHLPLVIEPGTKFGTLRLIGHLARSNPHSRLLRDDHSVIAVFHGPQSYVSPRWYSQPEGQVPTWNYAVVHVLGTVVAQDDPGSILASLEKLSRHTEPEWRMEIPTDLQGEPLSRAIMGFEISVDSITPKFKLSQNRNASDRAGVLEALAESGESGAIGLRELMAAVLGAAE